MSKLAFLFVLLIIAPYVTYRVERMGQWLNDDTLHDNQFCKRVDIELMPEDLAVFGKYVILSASDRYNIERKGIEESKRGKLLAFNTDDDSVQEIVLEGYDQHDDFNPLGADLYQGKTLYVINTSFKKQEQRIDAFDLREENSKVRAKYLRSISFGSDHFLKQDSIHFITPDSFYITQYLPDGSGFHKDNDYIRMLWRWFRILLMKTTNVKLCHVKKGEAECEIQDFGRSMNGIGQKGEFIYVSDSYELVVKKYNSNQDNTLNFIKEIQVGQNVNNIWIDQEKGKVLVATIPKTSDLWNYEGAQGKFHGAVLEIDEHDNVKELIVQDITKCTSAVVRVKDRFIFGSCSDNVLAVCDYKFR